MADVPKSWKTVALGDILTPEQIAHTVQIMSLRIPETEKTRQLKEYYEKFKTELAAKGYVPEYLAYAVPHFIMQAQEKQAQQQAKEAADITRDFFKDKRN